MIKISMSEINGKTIQTVSARDLYEYLKLTKTQFNRWISRNLLNNSFFIENIDFTVHRPSVDGLRKNSRGLWINEKGLIVEVDDYILTIDTAKHLAMLSQSAKAHEVRQYFIEVENKYCEKLKSIPHHFQMKNCSMFKKHFWV